MRSTGASWRVMLSPTVALSPAAARLMPKGVSSLRTKRKPTPLMASLLTPLRTLAGELPEGVIMTETVLVSPTATIPAWTAAMFRLDARA